MPDREKVIKGLKEMANDQWLIRHADYYALIAKEALELLKEQEAIEPIEMIDDFYPIGDPLRTIGWRCGKCGERIAYYDNFCPNCGKAVKRDDN